MIGKLLLGTFVLSASLAADGKAVYEQKCAQCHAYYIPVSDLMENFVKTQNKKLALKGPTINQLNFRLKQMIGEPDGDAEFHKMEVVEFIKDYVYYPDKQKSVCIKEVIDSFETMESMENKISEEDLEAVAEWIYNYTPPKEQ